MIEINTEFALAVETKEVIANGIRYRFSPSFVKVNGKPELMQLTVDAFNEDGDWEYELSECFEAGDIINRADYPWVIA